jgi:hypothetical protein
MYGQTRALTPEPASGAALRAGSLQALDFPQVLQYLFALFPQPSAVDAADVRQCGHSVPLVSLLGAILLGLPRQPPRGGLAEEAPSTHSRGRYPDRCDVNEKLSADTDFRGLVSGARPHRSSAQTASSRSRARKPLAARASARASGAHDPSSVSSTWRPDREGQLVARLPTTPFARSARHRTTFPPAMSQAPPQSLACGRPVPSLNDVLDARCSRRRHNRSSAP